MLRMENVYASDHRWVSPRFIDHLVSRAVICIRARTSLVSQSWMSTLPCIQRVQGVEFTIGVDDVLAGLNKASLSGVT